MTGVVVVTHGNLAGDLVAAACRIVGEIEGLTAVSLGWDEEVERARGTIAAAVREVDRGAGVVVLTDMFGGTPSNLALSLLEPGRVEIVSGVNLPMLIKFANLRESLSTAEIAVRIASQGRDAIRVASEVLAPDDADAPADDEA